MTVDPCCVRAAYADFGSVEKLVEKRLAEQRLELDASARKRSLGAWRVVVIPLSGSRDRSVHDKDRAGVRRRCNHFGGEFRVSY